MALQNIPMAFTAAPFGIPDRTLKTQLGYLSNLLQLVINKTFLDSKAASDAAGGLDNLFGSTQAVLDDSTVQADVQEQYDIQIEMQKIQSQQNQQGAFFKGSVPLIPSVNITQPYNGVVKCGNNLFNATMNNFTGTMSCQPLPQPGDAAGLHLKEGFQFYDAGTPVTIAGPYPLVHVVSIIPGTVVRVWAMMSSRGLKQMAVVPPSYYTVSSFTYSADKPPAVTVILKEPLSTISLISDLTTQNWENSFGKYLPPHQVNNTDWDDQIYVTFQSSVGPNFVDIAEWLINNYTNNSYDSASFGAVRGKVDGLQMNFALLKQENVMTILADLAYQARCVIFLKEDVFYLIFLPDVPTETGLPGGLAGTLTEDDIQVGSLQVSCTPTENLVTRYTAVFRPDYSPVYEDPVKIIFRFNINKYGVHSEEHDFYAYNTFFDVDKAATFWLIRKSLTWKILRCKLFVTRLDLEVFDAVNLSFSKPYIANGPVIGIITALKYNSTEHLIEAEIWTPVLLGTMEPYVWAFPRGATENDIWPTYREIQAGGGGGLSGGESSLPEGNSIRLPVGIIGGNAFTENGGLDAGEGPQDRFRWTTGNSHPGRDTNNASGGSGEQRPLADPRDQSKPETPEPEGSPEFTYNYAEFNINDPISICFPAVVNKKADGEADGGGSQKYQVTAYPNTLKGKAITMTVEQLQIDKDDEIPEGTWVLVAQVVGKEKTPDGKETLLVHRYMQTPVWLM
jgi:hypothetical protein